MKSKNSIVLIFLSIILVIILPSIDYLNRVSDKGEKISIILLRWSYISAILLIIWYINIYLINKKRKVIILYNLLLILTLTYISSYFNFNDGSPINFPRIILPTILFVAIQQSVKSIEQKQLLINENIKLKSETYKAELENLRNQINPHFLFNSLSTLQTLIHKNPISAEKYLLSLSDFYRKALLSNQANKTTLKTELETIKSYIFLLKTRFENGLIIEIDIDKESYHFNLPIFSLQLLIENSIKHNVVSNDNPLFINVYQEDLTSVTVTNNIQPKIKKEKSTETGLINLKKRYQLLGIDNGVVINQKDNYFHVTLKLF